MRLITIFIIISFTCFSQENLKIVRFSLTEIGSRFVLKMMSYKLTKEDLNNMGIDNPIYCDQVSIFGNSFGMLPNKNSDYRPQKLLRIV